MIFFGFLAIVEAGVILHLWGKVKNSIEYQLKQVTKEITKLEKEIKGIEKEVENRENQAK